MIHSPAIATKVANQLLEIEAVELSPSKLFTWASGKKSPIYCDNRVILSYHDIRTEIIDAFKDLVQHRFKDVDVIAGVATAGIPHGVLLAQELGKPFIYVRDKAKEHGRQNQIEGRFEPGQRVLVIEDLISTAKSSLVAVHACREAGLIVDGLAAIFSYELPTAKKNLEEAECIYYTLSNFPTLLEVIKGKNKYSKSEIEFMENWYMERAA